MLDNIVQNLKPFGRFKSVKDETDIMIIITEPEKIKCGLLGEQTSR